MTDACYAAALLHLDNLVRRIFLAAVDAERERRKRPTNREAQARARAFAECYADATGTCAVDAEHEIAAAADATTLEEW